MRRGRGRLRGIVLWKGVPAGELRSRRKIDTGVSLSEAMFLST